MGKRKTKIILPPELPPEIEEDAVQVSDEDLEFVKDNRDYAGFLSNLDTTAITRHVSRVAHQKEEELEALYEKRMKKLSLKKSKEEENLEVDPVDALPVKTLDGKLYYRTISNESKASEVTNNSKETKEVNEAENGNGKHKLSKAAKRVQQKKLRKEAKIKAKEDSQSHVEVQKSLQSEALAEVKEELSAEEEFARKKSKLAEIGMVLLADPDTNIKSLKDMLQLCKDENPHVVKLGLLSLLTVFKDIIPGYRIRLPTEKELEMKVSKEVRKMRNYESTLLNSYKAYLQLLVKLEKQSPFYHVAVRCICNLLDAVPHFNFWESLLATVVRNISSADDIIRKLCCMTIRSLFINDGKHGGEATLEAVKLITNYVKIHDCQLHPDCLDVFLSLSFDDDLSGHESKVEKFKRNEKDKKHKNKGKKQSIEESNQMLFSDQKRKKQEMMLKTREEVNADVKAAAFTLDSEERRKIQTEVLTAMFQTYFRVLKSCLDPVKNRSNVNSSLSGSLGPHPLLAPCLRGLAKFSHLIDLDFMSDLMSSLKRLAGYSDGDPLEKCLTVSERLQCCIVAFKVMKTNLDALNIDLQEFLVQLYNLLLQYNPGRENEGAVLAEALKIMLCEGRQHDMQRAAAFIKRLASFSLCYGSSEAMSALVTVKHLLLKNSKCRNLLENDAGGGSLSSSVAKYQPEATDPNLSGALASVVWELGLLSKHYHPKIAAMASSIASMSTHNQVYLSISSPQQAYTDLSIEHVSFHLPDKLSLSNRKRKRENAPFFSLCGKQIEPESTVDEDKLRKKFSDHFEVLNSIAENEKLRRKLNHTMHSLKLYKKYMKKKSKSK